MEDEHDHAILDIAVLHVVKVFSGSSQLVRHYMWA
jgi:hypothetical protein